MVLVALLSVAAATIATARIGLHLRVAMWTCALSVISFLFVMKGFLEAAPGAAKTASIYVIWPVIYLILIAGVRNEQIIKGVAKTIVIATIFGGLYSISYLLIETGILPNSWIFEALSFDWNFQAFGLHDEYVSMTYPGLNSLPFLIPFTLAALTTRDGMSKGPGLPQKVWLWVALFCGLATGILSGRRAIYLTCLMAPVLALFFSAFQPKEERSASRRALARVTSCALLIFVIFFFCLSSVYRVSLSGMAQRFTAGFDFSATTTDDNANIRHAQAHALIAGWMDKPLLGAGHGVPAYGSIRSQESPWTYELYYLALLYQTGLVGFTAYTSGIVWIFWQGLKIVRAGGYLSNYMAASLTGLSSILIANATNPYLPSADGMWAIFIPLALINFRLLRQSKTIATTGLVSTQPAEKASQPL